MLPKPPGVQQRLPVVLTLVIGGLQAAHDLLEEIRAKHGQPQREPSAADRRRHCHARKSAVLHAVAQCDHRLPSFSRTRRVFPFERERRPPKSSSLFLNLSLVFEGKNRAYSVFSQEQYSNLQLKKIKRDGPGSRREIRNGTAAYYVDFCSFSHALICCSIWSLISRNLANFSSSDPSNATGSSNDQRSL